MKIETERLMIRPWEIDDSSYFRAMSQDVGYTCFSTPGIYTCRDGAELADRIGARIKTFNENKVGKFLVFEKDSDEFIGTCGGDFFEFEGKQEIEIGYRLMLAHWGKGYATEAAQTMISYLFREVGANVIYGFALPQNLQSIKILEKLGFVFQCQFKWCGLDHQLFKIA